MAYNNYINGYLILAQCIPKQNVLHRSNPDSNLFWEVGDKPVSNLDPSVCITDNMYLPLLVLTLLYGHAVVNVNELVVGSLVLPK